MAKFTTRNNRELPPRARRIQPGDLQIQIRLGTTSACAENTTPTTNDNDDDGNYLRVRGEYAVNDFIIRDNLELPPRARRIPIFSKSDIISLGTTSACAENTLNELGLL